MKTLSKVNSKRHRASKGLPSNDSDDMIEEDLNTSDFCRLSQNFYLNRTKNQLYSKEGNVLLQDVEWAKPITDHPRKIIAGIDTSVFDSLTGVNEYEVVTDNEGNLVSMYKIKKSERKISDKCCVKDSESIDFLTIPEHNAFVDRMERISDSSRPSWCISSQKWIWTEDIRGEDITCSTFDCDHESAVRVHREKGRVIGSRPILSNHSENHYCKYCMYIEPDSDDLIEYYNPSDNSEQNDQEVSDLDDSEYGFRLIGEDSLSKMYIVISVCDTGNTKNDKNEYMTTVELVQDNITGNLVDRETPTIYKNNPEEAAKQALDLYESFWSGQYGDLSFDVLKSEILDQNP